jgi:hypothetical protein
MCTCTLRDVNKSLCVRVCVQVCDMVTVCVLHTKPYSMVVREGASTSAQTKVKAPESSIELARSLHQLNKKKPATLSHSSQRHPGQLQAA